jgi:endonuclease/exonuclease/phosphatase family metal-dependent hydrolase
MPFYHTINPSSQSGKRTVERLLALRRQLDSQVPKRSLSENLLLATWNIREFDSPAYGRRVPEAFYYIAEIVDRFDLVAVQEVRRDLRALNRLGRILGSHWKHIVTDVTEGNQGNMERMAFLYDSRKVRFGGLASELVIPPIKSKDENNKTVYLPSSQLARTPFIAGFSAGWTTFLLATVHILYGESKADEPQRIEEIRQIAQFLRNRSLDSSAWSRNLILLGDFNIFSPEDATMTAISDAGFIVPEEIQSLPSNVAQNRHYDQIAFRVRHDRFGTTGKAGVFNFYETVFTEEDEEIYIPQMGSAYHVTSSGKPRVNKSAYYRTYWRTHQMSDHLPMWVELRIDFSNEYLDGKLKQSNR